MLSLRNRSQGFTLIELLVVIAIIGILVTVTIVAINPFGQISKARDAQRKSDLKQIQTALELYYQDNDSYPSSIPSAGSSWPSTGEYLKKMPKDPGGKLYYYLQSGSGYYLYASLDNVSDPQKCTSSGTPCGSTNCGTGVTCTYGVSSSNLSP